VELAPEYRSNVESYPFILVSYRTIYHSGSGQWTHNNPQLRDRVSGFHENPLLMNHSAAKNMGISDGDVVTVESPSGHIQVRVALTEGIRPDCLGLGHGFGSTVGRVATLGEGVSNNYLIPDAGSTLEWQDLIGGESHVSTRVRIAR
jgi:thiosulfate reductase/polysulfide reductase chain A